MANLESATVDPKEVQYYQNLANTWWDQEGPFWPLHKLNTLRMQWILSQLQNHNQHPKPLAGKRVLDIGCGGGILSEALAKQGALVTAIDVVEKNIQVAKAHAAKSQLHIDYQLVDVEKMQHSQQQYDYVFNMEVVEHVADVKRFIHSCNALIKPQGLHFIASINRNWLAYIVAIFGAEYVTGLLPKGTHQYQKLVKPTEILALLDEDGFGFIADAGVAVNPIKRSMKLVNHTWINYMLVAEKNQS